MSTGKGQIKVALDARPLVWPVSGVSRVISCVIRHFPEPERFTFILCAHAGCHKDYADVLSMPNVEWLGGEGAAHTSPGLWYLTSMRGIVEAAQPDVYWGAQQTIPPGLSSAIPIVLTFYDLVLYFFPGSMRFTARVQQRALLRYSVRRADRILSISAQTQSDMIRKFSFPESKARVALLGYEKKVALRAASVQSKRARLPRNFILAVSTIEPRKNYGTLLEAFKIYCGRRGRSAYELVVAGRRGWEAKQTYEALDEFARDSGKLHIIDDADDALIERLYRKCAFFCIPSLYEGFGLPLLEALCHKKPCLSSDVGCLREIGEGYARFLPARSVSAWAEALEDYSRRHRIGRLPAPRFPAGEWSWKKTAELYRDAFCEVV